MADGSDTTLTADKTAEQAPNGLVAGIKSWAPRPRGGRGGVE